CSAPTSAQRLSSCARSAATSSKDVILAFPALGSWRDRDTERLPMASTESGSGRTANSSSQAPNPSGNGLPYKRIGTEEAFATPELLNLYRKLLASGIDDPGFNSLWGFYLNSPSDRPRSIIEKLQWLDERRVQDMDA